MDCQYWIQTGYGVYIGLPLDIKMRLSLDRTCRNGVPGSGYIWKWAVDMEYKLYMWCTDWT